MASTKFAIIQWVDSFTSLVNLENVKVPRKPVDQYEEGEYITALYGKKPYRARISEISDDRAVLMTKKGKNGLFPLKFPYEENKDRELQAADHDDPKETDRVVLHDKEMDKDNMDTQEVEEMDTMLSASVIEDIARKDQNSGEEQLHISSRSEFPDQDTVTEQVCRSTSKDNINIRPSYNRRLEKRVDQLEKEVKDLRASVRSLKRKLSNHGLQSSASPISAASSIDHPRQQQTGPEVVHETSTDAAAISLDVEALLASVGHVKVDNEKGINECVRKITLSVFTREDLVTCSRTGKKTVHSPGDNPRPSLDVKKLNVVEQAIQRKCSISTDTFKKKFDNLVKMERRSHKAKNN